MSSESIILMARIDSLRKIRAKEEVEDLLKNH
jgi:hypothetical protein